MRMRKRAPAPARGRRTRLGMERLEDRRVPATISGLVWKDSLGGGTQNGGELGLANVPLTLYRDGGNGTFDNGGGDDVQVEATVTGIDGTYAFISLSAGRYFVDI